MFPTAAILKDESFLSDVDAFKNDMSQAVMMNAEAFFDLVRPAWASTVLQLKNKEQEHVTQENFVAASVVAMQVDEIEYNAPESLQKGVDGCRTMRSSQRTV